MLLFPHLAPLLCILDDDFVVGGRAAIEVEYQNYTFRCAFALLVERVRGEQEKL